MKLSKENISDLLVTAFEGGINYWCDRVEILENPKQGKYASDVIGIGGRLRLYVIESDEYWDLYLENFTHGVEKAMQHFEYKSFQDFFDNHDAEVADVIIQFAVMGEIVFG